MTEFNPEANQSSDDGEWGVYRQNVTQEMLNETGYGTPLSEQLDQQFGANGWKWVAEEVSPIEQAEHAIGSAKSKLAREGLSNLMTTGDFVTNDGSSAAGFENRSAAPVFGTILVNKQKEE